MESTSTAMATAMVISPSVSVGTRAIGDALTTALCSRRRKEIGLPSSFIQV